MSDGLKILKTGQQPRKNVTVNIDDENFSINTYYYLQNKNIVSYAVFSETENRYVLHDVKSEREGKEIKARLEKMASSTDNTILKTTSSGILFNDLEDPTKLISISAHDMTFNGLTRDQSRDIYSCENLKARIQVKQDLKDGIHLVGGAIKWGGIALAAFGIGNIVFSGVFDELNNVVDFNLIRNGFAYIGGSLIPIAAGKVIQHSAADIIPIVEEKPRTI